MKIKLKFFAKKKLEDGRIFFDALDKYFSDVFFLLRKYVSMQKYVHIYVQGSHVFPDIRQGQGITCKSRIRSSSKNLRTYKLAMLKLIRNCRKLASSYKLTIQPRPG